MLLSFALLFSSCYTTLAALTRPPVVLTPASYNGLPTSSPPRSLTPSDADVHVELRALLRQPSVTLSTYYTTRPSPPVEARAETTLAPQIIGYTSTQGIFSPFNCHDAGTYFAVSGFARCCVQAQTDCPVYTECANTSTVRNDQYHMTCSGTDSQTVCVTGTIFESLGDTDPKLYVGCWPSWTGGNWKATRTVPSDDSSSGGGGGPPTGGKLAGIIVGAIAGLAALVAIGIFAAKRYSKLTERLVVLEGQARQHKEENGSKGSDKEADAEVTPPETAARRSSRVRPQLVGNALQARKDSPRNDSVGTISKTSVRGSKQVSPARVSGSLQDEIQEVYGRQEYRHELDVQRPEIARFL